MAESLEIVVNHYGKTLRFWNSAWGDRGTLTSVEVDYVDAGLKVAVIL